VIIRFGFYKKKLKLVFKKNKTGSKRPVSVQFSYFGEKLVQTGMTRFFPLWLGFFLVFLVWIWFGSVQFF